jgi:O-antigen/teichoic acid export membrane protein
MNSVVEKIKNFVKRARDLSTIGITDIVANAISAVFWLYMASVLGAESYGQINYLLAITGIASSVALLGSENTIMVYTAKGVKIQPPIYFITLMSGTITAAVLFSFFDSFEASVLVFGYIVFGLVGHEILGRKLYFTYSKFLITQRILMVALSIGLYYLMGPNGVLLGIGIAYFPYAIRIYKEFRDSKIDFSVLKPRIGFMMNSYIMRIIDAFSSSVDKLLIGPMLGFAILGNYQLGIQFLSLLEILPAIVYKYTLPHDATGNPNTRLKKLTILFSIGLAFLGFAISPFIIPITFPKYVHAIEIIQIMSIAVIPATISYMFISKLLGMEKSKIVLGGSIVYLVAQLITILLLGNSFGVTGIAVALVISTVVQTLFLFFAQQLCTKSK